MNARWFVKVGDLITLKQHCKDSGRLAIVASLAKWNPDECYIAFMDEPMKRIICSLNNIIKLN
jgi:hypothetical protein